jgi:hypothetical protein
MIWPHQLKLKTKNNILGWTFVVGSLLIGSARGFLVLLGVGILWSVLYTGGE